MTIYADLAAMATELLSPESSGGFGNTTAYIRTITVSYNSTTGTVTETPSDVAVNAVQVGASEQHTPGAQIEDGDYVWMLDAQATVEDKVLINSELYDVVEVWPVVPGDTFIACRVQVRPSI